MNVEYHLIGIPASVWNSWPKERPLSELAKDVLGMERRIQKGVNVGKERFRYMQTCEHFETLALQLAREGKACAELRLYENEAEVYESLVERFSNTALSEIDNIPITKAQKVELLKIGVGVMQRLFVLVLGSRRKSVLPPLPENSWIRTYPIGKSLYPPGSEVSTQRKIYRRLSRSDLVLPGVSADALRELAHRRAEFLRKVELKQGAVIEVLTLGKDK